jgi:hypothetical protein
MPSPARPRHAQNTRPRFQEGSTIEQREQAPVRLGLAVIATAVVAVTGIQPKDARPVAHTRLMGMARFVLLGLVVILV